MGRFHVVADSAAGRVWDPKQCVLVTPESVPRVVSRGSELNGSSYASGQWRYFGSATACCMRNVDVVYSNSPRRTIVEHRMLQVMPVSGCTAVSCKLYTSPLLHVCTLGNLNAMSCTMGDAVAHYDSVPCLVCTNVCIVGVTGHQCSLQQGCKDSQTQSHGGTAAHTQIEEVGVQLKQDGAPWLAFEGRWGSTVEAPALQEWFAKAENPISRSWLAQVDPPLKTAYKTCEM